MVDRVKNVRNSLLSVAAIIGSVEYFKVWTRDNYDVMHCYTRVNKIEDNSNIYRITSNGTLSCDPEAQHKQIHKKLNKLTKGKIEERGANIVYCLNENLEAQNVIDKVVGYYADKNDELKLNEYCQGSITHLI